MRVMNQAALVEERPDSRRELVDMEWPPSPENEHIESFTDYAKPEEIQAQSGNQRPAEPRRSSAEEAPHRDTGGKGRCQDTSERGKERSMGDKHQGLQSRDPSAQDSYVAHQNTLNSNGGKGTTSLLSNGRPSAFTDFSKSYRPQVSQTPQPQIIERNGTLPPLLPG
ncbi:unnamed protein product [Ranitomeya imitator]|uniref:Uncharacterized protein n=1 Tax=Ranitomeya imitator TaxID=111125 RepID=A0ABN9MI86_9NEOB|nr:unnamed protein product [Ranitomeya imitator]